MLFIRSEQDRLKYLSSIQRDMDFYISLVLAHYKDEVDDVADLYNLVLKRKGILLDTLVQQRSTVHGSILDQNCEEHSEVAELNRLIAEKTFGGSGNEGVDVHNRVLGEWYKRKAELEKEISTETNTPHFKKSFSDGNLAGVSKALPDETALIDIVSFRMWETSEPRYIAFVLLPDGPENITLIDLGSAEEIDELVRDYRDKLEPRSAIEMFIAPESKSAESTHKSGVELRKRIYDPMVKAVNGFKKLIISPDGNLNLIPYEILPISDTESLNDTCAISYVSTARDILNFKIKESVKADEPVVFADPLYNLSDTPELTRSGQPRSRKDDGRELVPGSLLKDFPDGFPHLYGTRLEGELLKDLLGVEPRTGTKACKSEFMALRSPLILHIATHGFYIKHLSAERGVIDKAFEQNPFLRSGFVLAGVNSFLFGDKIMEECGDGIVTALDVAGLDLDGTELAVLSACNSGLGVMRAGEGVHGIRRAFAIAGVKTLVMALWQVPDLVTPILMHRFYENLLVKDMDRIESLRMAREYIRNIKVGELKKSWFTDQMIRFFTDSQDLRKQVSYLLKQEDEYRPFRDPVYWGGLICQGYPGPLVQETEKSGTP